jgi:hypothetical protein
MREAVFDETLQLRIRTSKKTGVQADRGSRVILSGEFGGARVAYLGTNRDPRDLQRHAARPPAARRERP